MNKPTYKQYEHLKSLKTLSLTSLLFPLKELTSEERFHVELHFSPGVKGVEEEENAPTGFGFRPASAEVARQVESNNPGIVTMVLFCRYT